MVRPQVPTKIGVAAAALLLLAGYLWAMTGSRGPPPVEGPVPEIDREAKPAWAVAPARRTSVNELIAARRVEASMVRPLVGRAFRIERPRERRPPGDAAAFARTLVPAAMSGDGTASYRLYLIAAECHYAVSPDAVESYRFTRHLLAPDYPKQMARKMEECEALLLDPQLSDTGGWLKRGAEQGSLEAGLVYGISLEKVVGGPQVWARHPERVIEYKRKAMRYLEEGAALGNVSALLMLSETYKEGFFVPADPIKALAYRMALERVSLDPVTRNSVERMEEGLSLEQRKKAERDAGEITKWCCLEGGL